MGTPAEVPPLDDWLVPPPDDWDTESDGVSPPPTPPPPPPNTLMAALKPYSAPPTAYGRYTPFLTLTARLLGECPSYYPVLSLAPAALATHVGLFSRLFGSPAVDVRAPGALPPRLRRLAYMAASRANGCAYCAANGCAFGDVFRGPIAAQMARARIRDGEAAAAAAANPAGDGGSGGGGGGGNAGSSRGGSGGRPHRTTLRIDADDADATAAEAAILRLVALAVPRPFPPALLPRLAAATHAVRAAVGAPAAEMVQSVVALAGAVNTLTGALGVPPEPAARRLASTLLPPVGSIPWAAFDNQGGGEGGGCAGGGAPAAAAAEAGHPVPPPAGDQRGDGWPAGVVSHERTSSVTTESSGGEAGAGAGAGAAGSRRTNDGSHQSKPIPERSRAAAQLNNLAGLLRTLPAAAAGLEVEAELYADIPTTIAPLYAWVDARLGATAGRFLLRPACIEVARAFCFALRENVLVDDLPAPVAAVAAAVAPGGVARHRWGGGGGSGALRSPDASQWTVADRLRLVAAYAAATRSAGLANGARAAAARCGAWPSAAIAAADLAAFAAAPDTATDAAATAAAPVAAINTDSEGGGGVDSDVIDRGGGGSGGGGGPTVALAAARRIVRACATGVEGLRGTAVANATAAIPGRGVVEVASLVSTAELWRRMELLFGEGWTPHAPPVGGQGRRAAAAAAAAAVSV